MDLLSTSPPKVSQQSQLSSSSSSAAMTKAPSIFSPEWNENQSQTQNSLPSLTSSNGANGGGSDTRNPHENSPKKRPSMPADIIKKEKRDALHHPTVNQTTTLPQQQSTQHSQHSQHRSMPNQTTDKRPMKREPILTQGMQYDANLPQNLFDGVKPSKRSFSVTADQLPSLIDGDYRDAKLRKMEPSLSPIRNPSEMHKSGYDDLKASTKPFGASSVSTTSLNGIETNPDLVSSLLKESLSDSKFGQSTLASANTNHQSQMAPAPNYNAQINNYPMHQQMEPSKQMPVPSMSAENSMKSSQSFFAQQQQQQQPTQSQQPAMQQSMAAANQTAIPTSMPSQLQPNQFHYQSTQSTMPSQIDVANQPTQIQPGESVVDGEIRAKSEKKKKKEKHKNKDKEKSKDKEERKKHKKDKDRRKDKDRSHHSSHSDDASGPPPIQNPIRITIPKEKLNMSSQSEYGVQDNGVVEPHQGVRLKIQKERIKEPSEGERDGNIGGNGNSTFSTSMPTPATTSLKIKISKDMLENPGHGISTDSGHSSSHKKKDRHREKEKANKV